MKLILGPSTSKRFVFFCIADAVLVVVSLFLSFLFHFDFTFNIDYFGLMTEVVLFFIVIKIAALASFRVYNMSWRYASINDMLNIVLALILSELLLIVISLPNSLLPPVPITRFPKRIFLVDGIISLFFVAGLRMSKRLYLEVIRERGIRKKGKRTIILGAGNTGEMILRDMARLGYGEFYPVALLDDDTNKIGTLRHGIKVSGKTDRLEAMIAKEAIEAVIVAIPSLSHKKLKEIYDVATRANVGTIKIVPRIYNFDTPDLNLKSLEDISIEDLIGRQTVQIDYSLIKNFLKDRIVLITGAGGSIGSELVMQICAFQPGRVVLFDIDDTDLHAMTLKLSRHYPHLSSRAHFVIGDVRDARRVEEVFAQFKPEIVFHAAAYKHVPMMEENAKEAVKVNVLGTYIVAQAALAHHVERFIMISTDKAVRPTSIMGATKRIAEYICQAFNANGQKDEPAENKGDELDQASDRRDKSTRFMSVRFGNVLGSRGSVVPLFLDQLKHGGPLTVTHRDMVRYFMTIPEAVSLILQASTMGRGGEVFVLDMGEPVKIVELAEELITIQGLVPYKDIDIVFTGPRPGEKIFEEILTAEEGTVASKHEKVFIARNGQKYNPAQIEGILKEFETLIADSSSGGHDDLRALLKKYVRHYEGQ